MCIHHVLGLAPVQVLVLVLDLVLVSRNMLVSWKKGTSLQYILNKETLQPS